MIHVSSKDQFVVIATPYYREDINCKKCLSYTNEHYSESERYFIFSSDSDWYIPDCDIEGKKGMFSWDMLLAFAALFS